MWFSIALGNKTRHVSRASMWFSIAQGNKTRHVSRASMRFSIAQTLCVCDVLVMKIKTDLVINRKLAMPLIKHSLECTYAINAACIAIATILRLTVAVTNSRAKLHDMKDI
jgi:hypothetical protein